MTPSARRRLVSWVAWIGVSIPAAILAWRILTDDLGANPVEALILWSGMSTLVVLLAALAITPLRRVTGWNEVVKVRRRIGLAAFAYGTSHLLIYVVLHQWFAIDFIIEDIVERPFITVGMAAWVILLPLAVTSTRGWIRRLGSRWKRLHQMVYLAGGLGVLHYYWKVKADTRLPLLFAGILAVLLLSRVLWWWGRRSRVRQREAAPAGR